MVLPTSITPHIQYVPGALTHVFKVNIFGGSMLTTVTNSHSMFVDWVHEVIIRGNTFPRHIGFEIESNERDGLIGTVQLYYGNQCMVFRCMQDMLPWRTSPCPPMLKQLLGDRNNIFVGTEMRLKIHWLCQQLGGLTERVVCKDLDEYAPQLRRVKRNLLDSVGLLHGIESNWNRMQNLSFRQVHVASIDVFLNIQIATWVGIA